MAPFKLKFRMGGSRSTSQEHDPDPQVNEALLNHHNSAGTGASNSTIDSADCNSVGSVNASERKSLLPNKGNNFRLGYINRHSSAVHGVNEAGGGAPSTIGIPKTPPPPYEHVLEEDTRLSSLGDLSAIENVSSMVHSRQSSMLILQRNNANRTSLERLSLNDSITNTNTNINTATSIIVTQCTDPDCQENYVNNEQQQEVANDNDKQQQQHLQNINDNNTGIGVGGYGEGATGGDNGIGDNADDDDDDIDNRRESNDSREFLISTNMATNSTQNGNFIDNCAVDCDEQYCSGACGGGADGGGGGDGSEMGANDDSRHDGTNNDFCDPLMNQSGYCGNETNQAYDGMESSHHDNDSEQGWDTSDNYQQQPQQHYQQQAQFSERSLTPEIISNKSSKEMYKDWAKQWGITCKMSDGCRCMECQSHYFDCEFDDNEHQKTDGGLGAGTPMFISEVMHGSACNIL